MTLLDDIVNELVNSDNDLTTALLKTKVLASRISNLELSGWVDNELNGYGEKVSLPQYRIMSARVTMNYLNGPAQLKSQPIPMSGMKKIVRDRLEKVELRETIATLFRMVIRTLISLF